MVKPLLIAICLGVLFVGLADAQKRNPTRKSGPAVTKTSVEAKPSKEDEARIADLNSWLFDRMAQRDAIVSASDLLFVEMMTIGEKMVDVNTELKVISERRKSLNASTDAYAVKLAAYNAQCSVPQADQAAHERCLVVFGQREEESAQIKRDQADTSRQAAAASRKYDDLAIEKKRLAVLAEDLKAKLAAVENDILQTKELIKPSAECTSLKKRGNTTLPLEQIMSADEIKKWNWCQRVAIATTDPNLPPRSWMPPPIK
jgi:hypothetical protein